MKTYISGLIETHSEELSKVKFEQAEQYLLSLSHAPVNPFKINSHALVSWPLRLEILDGCEAVFMLSDWMHSHQSRVERYYSEISGKVILFQSQKEQQDNAYRDISIKVEKIKEAIHEVTGQCFTAYSKGSEMRGKRPDRKPDGFFARMIFAHQCERSGMTPECIMMFISRGKGTIKRYLAKYHDEYNYDPIFRDLARRVEDTLIAYEISS